MEIQKIKRIIIGMMVCTSLYSDTVNAANLPNQETSISVFSDQVTKNAF